MTTLFSDSDDVEVTLVTQGQTISRITVEISDDDDDSDDSDMEVTVPDRSTRENDAAEIATRENDTVEVTTRGTKRKSGDEADEKDPDAMAYRSQRVRASSPTPAAGETISHANSPSIL